VNGVSYSLGGVTQITIDGSGGNDTLTLVGGSLAETVVLRPGTAEITSVACHLTASGFENIQFSGNAGDRATLYGSAGDDLFEATPQWARLSGGGYVSSVSGVGSVVAIAQAGGADVARHHDVFVDGAPAMPEAPEICVEVVSPSNSVKELSEKREAYLAVGAEEVWIVYPQSKRSEFYGKDGPLPRSAYAVDLSDIFS
jgi:hypothetical protein